MKSTDFSYMLPVLATGRTLAVEMFGTLPGMVWTSGARAIDAKTEGDWTICGTVGESGKRHEIGGLKAGRFQYNPEFIRAYVELTPAAFSAFRALAGAAFDWHSKTGVSALAVLQTRGARAALRRLVDAGFLVSATACPLHEAPTPFARFTPDGFALAALLGLDVAWHVAARPGALQWYDLLDGLLSAAHDLNERLDLVAERGAAVAAGDLGTVPVYGKTVSVKVLRVGASGLIWYMREGRLAYAFPQSFTLTQRASDRGAA